MKVLACVLKFSRNLSSLVKLKMAEIRVRLQCICSVRNPKIFLVDKKKVIIYDSLAIKHHIYVKEIKTKWLCHITSLLLESALNDLCLNWMWEEVNNKFSLGFILYVDNSTTPIKIKSSTNNIWFFSQGKIARSLWKCTYNCDSIRL